MVMSDLVGLMSLVTVFALGLAWLCHETEFLHVRLPVGKTTRHDFINIYEGAMPEFKPVVVRSTYLLPVKCSLTERIAFEDEHRVGHYSLDKCKPSYQQMLIGNNTVTLSATLPKLYEYIKEAQKAQTIKPHDGLAVAPYNQIPMFIEKIRTGSHVEPDPETDADGTTITYGRYVTDYKTVYHDCLVPKEWLMEHEHDLDDFHPTIDISVNGQTLNVNGNYEKNLIKSFMLQHTKRVRVGKKMQTVFDGYEIVDMGGGLKVVDYPEERAKELATV